MCGVCMENLTTCYLYVILKVEWSNTFPSKKFSDFFLYEEAMGISFTKYKKKRYVIGLLFAEMSFEISKYRVFYWKIAVYFNLSKQVEKLCFNDVYCYLATNKTFQLKILYLKFVEFYTLKKFEPQNIVRIEQIFPQKAFICLPQKFCSKNISDFYYIMRIRVLPLQNKKEIDMSSSCFFRIELKPSENIAKFIHTWYT